MPPLAPPPPPEATLSLEEQAARLYRGEALAPMVRASTTPLRSLARAYGADFCYTEELVDRSLVDSVRVENKALGTIDYLKDDTSRQISAKQQRKRQAAGINQPALLLRIDPALERDKLVCQLGTGEYETAVAAARHVHRDVSAIDVNMGCPKKFSVSGGMGSALLDDPYRACRIVRALTEEMATSAHNPIPVSAKIRLLRSTQATVDFVAALIEAGAKAVAIHGRRPGTPEQESANWDCLKEVVTLCKSKYPATPILLNGDFYTRHEFTSFQKSSGADGVLLARPALYNTSIFRKPAEALETTTTVDASSSSMMQYSYDSPLLLDKTTVIQDYLKQAVRYDAHHKNIKYVVCEMMNNRRHPHERVPHLPQKVYPGRQTIGQVCNCKSLEHICRVWNVDYEAELRRQRTSSTTTASSTEALAGEHRYSDEYLLQKQELSTANSTSTPPILTKTEKVVPEAVPVPKRARVEPETS